MKIFDYENNHLKIFETLFNFDDEKQTIYQNTIRKINYSNETHQFSENKNIINDNKKMNSHLNFSKKSNIKMKLSKKLKQLMFQNEKTK